jgi:protein TonB
MFQVMGAQPDPRIGQAVWQAIQNCKFRPGADAQGRPVNMWVILPLVFTAG